MSTGLGGSKKELLWITVVPQTGIYVPKYTFRSVPKLPHVAATLRKLRGLHGLKHTPCLNGQ